MDWIVLIEMTLLTVLAFANGSNDVSKGIATLVGSGVTDYRRAMAWGTVWTVIGGILALFFSMAMVTTFTTGILADSGEMAAAAPALSLSVTFGAMGWVLFASRYGLPVSTTHAITGAICGAGLTAQGWDGILWASLTHKIALPLAFSPLMAAGFAFFIIPPARRTLSGWQGHCVCLVPVQPTQILVGQSGSFHMISTQTPSEVATVVDDPACDGAPRLLALRLGPDTLHWITSGLTSLARGLNDAPKMATLLAGAVLLAPASAGSGAMTAAFGAVALGMGAGSLIAGRKVTEVLAEKVTRMDHLEGFSANLTTALLVTVAARFGLPVSTTHVSSGAIVGMGLRKDARQVRWNTLRDMGFAWVVTLPVTGLIAAGSYLVLSLWRIF